MKNYFAALDVGSTYTKGLAVNREEKIIATFVQMTRPNMLKAAEQCFSKVCEQAGLTRDDVFLTAIGYGKDIIEFADEKALDLICIGKCIHHFHKNVRNVVEIGGQDAKIININEKGKVIDFVMNDKCSAGTGQFFEVVSKTLGIDIEELPELALKSKKPVSITSHCSVFAQTEIISLLGQNKSREDIARGLVKSIAYKIKSLTLQLGLEDDVCLTGGVALNKAFVAEFEAMIGKKVNQIDIPQFSAAYGAVLMAIEKFGNEKDSYLQLGVAQKQELSKCQVY